MTGPPATHRPVGPQSGLATRLWCIGRQRNLFFVGRTQALEDIDLALQRTGRAAIVGMGGIGKTQVALEFAYSRFSKPYRFAFWANGATRESLAAGLVDAAMTLGLGDAVAPGASERVALASMSRWLQACPPCLLVVDNADDPEGIADLLPARSPCHLLLTSRVPRLEALGIDKPVVIGVWPREQSVKFLQARTSSKDLPAPEAAAADAIALELGNLPLALEQAAAYIQQRRISFAGYLALYRQQGLQVLERQGPVLGDYPASVATTWRINREQAIAESPFAGPLLDVAAFMAAEGIPVELARLFARRTRLNDDAVADALAALERYSLIQRSEDDTGFSVHPVVQVVLQDRLAREDDRDTFPAVCRALLRIAPRTVKAHDWPAWERLARHAESIARHADRLGCFEGDVLTLIEAAAAFHSAGGSLRAAESLGRTQISLLERRDGVEALALRPALFNLRATLQDQGRTVEADACARRARHLLALAMGEDDFDVVAERACGLGFGPAQVAALEPLAAMLADSPPETPDEDWLIEILKYLVMNHLNDHDLERLDACLLAYARIAWKNSGKRRLQLLADLFLDHAQRAAEVLPSARAVKTFARKMCATVRLLHGSRSLDYADALLVAADWYDAQRVEEVCERALRIIRRIVGKDNRELGRAYCMAAAYLETSSPALALSHAQEALRIAERENDPDSLETRSALPLVARLMSAAGLLDPDSVLARRAREAEARWLDA